MTSLANKINWPNGGRYVVALSGGVDSVTLLDMLARDSKKRGYKLEVAHFNHGWSDQAKDYENLARSLAEERSLRFHVERESVPKNEASAREARYKFLRKVMKETASAAIVTAHHYDDLVETVILNVQRGTGRRGLTPFSNAPGVLRPLVRLNKSEVRRYAEEHELKWCEDATNHDLNFERNKVRHQLLPNINQKRLSKIIEEAATLNASIDFQLKKMFDSSENSASGVHKKLKLLPFHTLTELIAAMIQATHAGAEVHSRAIQELALDIKNGRFREPRQLTKQLSAHLARGRVNIVFSP